MPLKSSPTFSRNKRVNSQFPSLHSAFDSAVPKIRVGARRLGNAFGQNRYLRTGRLARLLYPAEVLAIFPSMSISEKIDVSGDNFFSCVSCMPIASINSSRFSRPASVAPVKFVNLALIPSIVADDRLAYDISAPEQSAPLRDEISSTAFLRFAILRLVLLSIAERSIALSRFVPSKFAPDKSTLTRQTPSSFKFGYSKFDRSAPFKSTLGGMMLF